MMQMMMESDYVHVSDDANDDASDYVGANDNANDG